MKLRIKYGEDPLSRGFYWPDSPAKRRELLSVKRNNPAVYESVYQCRPGQREGSIFLENDFVEYKAPNTLARGARDPEVAAFCRQFYALVAAWDTAFEATHVSDHTVGVVAGLLPCISYHCGEDVGTFGECEPHLDVYLLDLIRKRLQWGDLTTEFRLFHQKWNPLVHLVEKRGSGISLYQSMPSVGIAVEGIMTTESKRARAVSGTEAGSVQGWFRQHRVLLPSGADWVPGYKTEMKDFTGDDDSADDQVDATVHLVNYAIQTGGGMALISSEWSPERIEATFASEERLAEMDTLLPKAGMMAWLDMLPAVSDDPFAETCRNCTNFTQGYCRIHKRQVVALDFCEHFTDVHEAAL